MSATIGRSRSAYPRRSSTTSSTRDRPPVVDLGQQVVLQLERGLDLLAQDRLVEDVGDPDADPVDLVGVRRSPDRLVGDQPASGDEHVANPLEGPNRIAQVGQGRTVEGQVHRAADPPRLELVDVAGHPLDRRAQRLGGDPKPATELEARIAGARLEHRAAQRRELDLVDVAEVDRDHLGPPALRLERPEAVEGSNVEDAQTAELVGKNSSRRLAQVDVARSDDSRARARSCGTRGPDWRPARREPPRSPGSTVDSSGHRTVVRWRAAARTVTITSVASTAARAARCATWRRTRLGPPRRLPESVLWAR